jgi:hypothetical protein
VIKLRIHLRRGGGLLPLSFVDFSLHLGCRFLHGLIDLLGFLQSFALSLYKIGRVALLAAREQSNRDQHAGEQRWDSKSAPFHR